ncbi:Alpha/Beta hydrolase protein [Astrocystis sublimbata]|nr:Alpha/Beta hydrolase protein [Astrocystis sublimbata]
MPAKTSDGPMVTRRSDLSTLYKVFRKAARPMRSHIISVKGDYPPGSPRLEKHPGHIDNVKIKERQIIVQGSGYHSSGSPNPETLWTYEFCPPTGPVAEPQATGRHTVYFFAGGGFVQPAASEQWKLCAHLASSLAHTGVQMVLVSYPLAPKSPAKDSLPLLRRWLAQALGEEEAGQGIVSLMGDSSGGNIALSLALWWADQLELKREANIQGSTGERNPLRSVLMVSPPLDMRVTNPEISHVDEKDPVLGRSNAETAARHWSKGSDPLDSYLSPVLADVSNLKKSKVLVHCVVGTQDVLAPDVSVFLEKCKEGNVKGEWLVWDGLMHDFPLAACYGLREGKEGRDWVVKLLRDTQ